MNTRQVLCLNEYHARNSQPRPVVQVPFQEVYRGFEILHTFIFVFAEGLRTVPSVGEWLEGADLIQYENIFMVNGFDDMRFMVSEVFTFKTRNFSLNAPDWLSYISTMQKVEPVADAGFSRQGYANSKGGERGKPIIWPIFFPKTAWKWKEMYSFDPPIVIRRFQRPNWYFHEWQVILTLICTWLFLTGSGCGGGGGFNWHVDRQRTTPTEDPAGGGRTTLYGTIRSVAIITAITPSLWGHIFCCKREVFVKSQVNAISIEGYFNRVWTVNEFPELWRILQ